MVIPWRRFAETRRMAGSFYRNGAALWTDRHAFKAVLSRDSSSCEKSHSSEPRSLKRHLYEDANVADGPAPHERCRDLEDSTAPATQEPVRDGDSTIPTGRCVSSISVRPGWSVEAIETTTQVSPSGEPDIRSQLVAALRPRRPERLILGPCNALPEGHSVVERGRRSRRGFMGVAFS